MNEKGGEWLFAKNEGPVWEGVWQNSAGTSCKSWRCLGRFCKSWPFAVTPPLGLPPPLASQLLPEGFSLKHRSNKTVCLRVTGTRVPSSKNTTVKSGFLGKKQGNQEEATWMSPNYPEPHSMASKVAALKLSSLKYVIPRTCPLPGNLSQGAVWGPSGCSLWPSLLQRMWGSHWEVGRGACVVFPPWSTTNE